MTADKMQRWPLFTLHQRVAIARTKAFAQEYLTYMEVTPRFGLDRE
jgi:ABC-type polar amino acid transport system ATPase subunit